MSGNGPETHTFEDLADTPPASRRLARLLSDANVLGDDELLVVQKQHPSEFLGEVLVREGILLESYLHGLLIRTLYLPWIAVDRCQVSPDAVELLAEGFCRERRIMPVSRARDFLTIACVNPLDEESIDEVRSITGMNVRVVLCSAEQQETLMKIAFARQEGPNAGGEPGGGAAAERAEPATDSDVGLKAAELADQLIAQAGAEQGGKGDEGKAQEKETSESIDDDRKE
ncbi:MAG: hypothetical protein ABIF82_06495 [Planctomycetota bacterium]